VLAQSMLPELDYQRLDRELDRVKTKVFLGKSAAFYGSVMSSLRFEWDKSIPTAATDGEKVIWNPYYFYYLDMDGRKSILMHEIRHVANLHMLRRGNRDPRIWNYACDTILDNEMDHEDYVVSGPRIFPLELFPPGSKTFVNHDYDDLSAEQVYDIMIKNAVKIPENYRPDIIEGNQSGVSPHTIVNMVVSATHAAQLSGGNKAGDIPGDVETVLRRFLKPKLPWKQLFQRFFTQLTESEYTWKRPNRRFSSMYLPSIQDVDGGLEHIMYFEDVSGSISDNDVVRFNSEVKYVWDTFKPLKMTLVQFDTRITKETTYDRGDPFEEVIIVGRGGTCLSPVREHILTHRPTAVVIFSDLECSVMPKLPSNLGIPILWVCINNCGARVEEGQLIHINE